MGQVIPTQHPAVVLRSRFNVVRTLLAIALIALSGLAAAVVVVATQDDGVTTSLAKPGEPIEYGGFNPQTGTPVQAAKPGQPIEYGSFNPQTGRPMSVATPDAAAPTVARPDESKIAAEIWRAQQAGGQSGPGGPDESRVAAAIGR